MSNQTMYELSPKALARIKDYESRYSTSHRAMNQLALRGGDPELLMNPHLGDYADILLPTFLSYATALRQSRDKDPQVEAKGLATVRAMTPEIQRLCSVVQNLHRLDAIANGRIPNNSFVKDRLIPLIRGSSN